MKFRISYKNYLDKVFGCWLGKCVAGTIGAPYEGAKELFDFEYTPSLIENMLPNDDLDLQILWLAVLEEKGIHFTSDDLAEAFFTKCPYAPGEYAIFKKNYARGIRPPVSGWFSNRYYIEGMGCPIRSEIWACVAPGNPELAAEFAARDGVLDHRGNSVYAEQFLAGLEAGAFFTDDLDILVKEGLKLIPDDSKTARLVRDVWGWCKESSDWRYVRSRIIRDYGHPDCTNMFQNIGITLLALYFGNGNFLDTTMIALNCGFDTDCTCATAGSVLGIIRGAQYLMKEHGFTEQGYVLGVDIERRSDRVYDLAEDTCLIGIYIAEQLNRQVTIEDAPKAPVITPPSLPPLHISVEYDGIPAVGIGDTRDVTLSISNTTGRTVTGTLEIEAPEGWSVKASESSIELAANETVKVRVSASVPLNLKELQETNLLDVIITLQDGEKIRHTFGIVGAAVWQVFGPFWQNHADVPPLKPGESYYSYIHGSNDQEYADNGRAYHLNTKVDINREYMTLEELLNPEVDPLDASREGRLVSTYEDRFSVNELVGFQGPCAVYLVRRIVCPEDRTVGIQIGHTDAYKVWINGDLISERDNADWWTAENAHILNFPLKKGVNTLVVRLNRRSDKADFSLVFSKGGSCTEHYVDMASLNPLSSGD